MVLRMVSGRARPKVRRRCFLELNHDMMATSTTIQTHSLRSNDSFLDSEGPRWISGLESEVGEGLEIINWALQICVQRLAQRLSGIED